MKIRTDFVTNSSSSSYIFKECDIEEIKTKLEKILDETSASDPKKYKFYMSNFVHNYTFWSEEDAKKFEETVPSFHGKPSEFSRWISNDFFGRVRHFSQLGYWDIDDIDGALCHGIMEIIFYGAEQYLASGRKTHTYEHYIDRIKNKDISEEIADKIAGYLILDLYNQLRDMLYHDPEDQIFPGILLKDILNEVPDSPLLSISSDDQIPEVFTHELLDTVYKPFVSNALLGDFAKAFIKAYEGTLYSRFEKYIGMTLGQIFEGMLGKVWVYYCDCDTNVWYNTLSKEFAKLPEFLFGEDHF